MSESCMAIEAEFVFGPVRCGSRATGFVIDDEGDRWAVCDDHTSPAPTPNADETGASA